MENRHDKVPCCRRRNLAQSRPPRKFCHFLRERISSYKLPTAVEFRDALPRSFIGKVLRRVLVEGEKEPEGD